MEYLFYMHDLKAFRISSEDPMEITKPCSECGEIDKIYFSWEKEEREETLNTIVTGANKDPNKVLEEINDLESRDKMISATRIYYASFRDTIQSLSLTSSITREEYLRLMKINRQAEKDQIKLIKKEKPIFKLVFSQERR